VLLVRLAKFSASREVEDFKVYFTVNFNLTSAKLIGREIFSTETLVSLYFTAVPLSIAFSDASRSSD
jgi:hypothetical protein